MSWTYKVDSREYYNDGELVSSLDGKKSIFIPAAGYYYQSGETKQDEDLRLWTATRRASDNSAYGVSVEKRKNSSGNYHPYFYTYSTPDRYYGMPVRAVVQP